MIFPFPVLLCDIGGTNVRFAYQLHRDAPLESALHFKTKDHPGLETILDLLFSRLPVRPRSMIACVAGPIKERQVKMTNAEWTIDGASLVGAGAFEQGLLLNDFEAQALSLPVLQPDWVRPIGAPFDTKPGVQLIMGLGTGLGTAALLEVENRHLALASEAGHMDFGPISAEELEIWPYLDTMPFDRVSAETILSGPGLIRLHRARCMATGRLAPEFDEVELITRAYAEPEGAEARTLRFLWNLVARFASDLALAFFAKGGVTFSGGVLPRLLPFLDLQKFREHFEDKSPYGEILRGIGTRLIVTDDFVLTGMAGIAAAPQGYAIDYAGRAWR